MLVNSSNVNNKQGCGSEFGKILSGLENPSTHSRAQFIMSYVMDGCKLVKRLPSLVSSSMNVCESLWSSYESHRLEHRSVVPAPPGNQAQ